MAELNGIEFDEWEAYIFEKFPVKDFDVFEDKEASAGKVITITSKDRLSKTKITFDFPTTGLCRACFYNPDSPLHNAENDKERRRALMYSDYELSDENLANTNDYLEIPLCYGWTEQTTRYKGKLIKCDLLYYDSVQWQTIPIMRNLSWINKAGCLLILVAWPILWMQHVFMKSKLARDTGNVRISSTHIPPMVNYNISKNG